MTTSMAGEHRDQDLVIVGGGLAGLSLACHLLEAGIGDRRLLVLESRTTYRHDRYWCSWGQPNHPFADCISHSWHRWRVSADASSHVQQSASQPYHCIPSGDLYAEATRRIAAHPNASLQLGCPVAAVREAGEWAEVHLANGKMMRCSRVFDSRLPDRGPSDDNEVDLVQDFLGWRVRCDAACFDPTTVTLMQFAAGGADVRFTYVLPFSAHEALVESTVFAAAPLRDDEHESLLRRHLQQSLPGLEPLIVETERGCVPMSTRRRAVRSPTSRIVPIGTAAGLVKPSTGYSFEAVQRWSRAVARDVAAGCPSAAPPARGRRALAMDRLFLAFLRRHPERMPALFLRMFERVAPDVLVRFLSDRASLRDAAQVAAALPVLPMLGEAIRSFRLWARSA